MSSIEITEEKIIIKRKEIESEIKGEFCGLMFNKKNDELSKIKFYAYTNQWFNLFTLKIEENTRVKIETLEGHSFKRVKFNETDKKCLEIQLT